MRNILLAIILLAPLPVLRAQTAADPSGHWEGAIHAPFGEINLEVDLAKNAEGVFAATYGNPKDNLKGFPLANVAIPRACSWRARTGKELWRFR